MARVATSACATNGTGTTTIRVMGLMRDLDLPRGEERELVVDRNRVYELNGGLVLTNC